MKRITFFMFSLLLSISLGFAQGKAVITFEKTVHDFGQVLEADGDVSCEFVLKNTGNIPLVLNRVNASCGCTTPQWPKEPIAPGKTGTIKVTYSVKGRIGPFSKTVTIQSNDEKGNATVVIKGEVLKEKPNVEATHPIAMGDLRLDNNKIDFEVVKNSETKTAFIEVFNTGNMPMSLQFDKLPQFISIATEPVAIQPNNKGKIKIKYDAALANVYGSQKNDINIIVNSDTKNSANNIITITGKIVDDFDKLTAQEKQEAPKLNVNPATISFVNDKKSSQLLRIANSGKTNLLIRSIKPTSDAIQITGGKNEVKPGEIVEFKVNILPKKITSNLNEEISIITNDPNNSIRDIQVIAKK